MDSGRGIAGIIESEEARARAGRWLLAASILGSALGLGAIHTPVLCVVAAAATVASALLWFDAEPLEPRPAATALVGVALFLVGWTLVQLVPLPIGVLRVIAPENADVWLRCLAPLREEGPTSAPISLDPTATRVEVLRGVTYLVVFVGALRVARRQEGVVFLERVLVASAVAIGAAALLHPALGARKVFGLYEPGETQGFDPHHLAPLLNLNHLAAYLDIGLFVATASLIERRDTLPRPLALAVVLLLTPTVFWTLSRGGAAAMVLGAVLVAGVVFAARRTRRRQLVAPFAAFAGALGGGAILLLAAFDETRTKFARGDLAKLDLVASSFGLLRRFGILGVGRGAFESTYPSQRTFPEYWVNTHPENVIAQWTTEWGVPVALLALGAIAWSLRPQTALARSRPPAGAWAALVAIALHNLVDFSSEIPGVMVALAVAGGIVTGGTGGGSSVVRRQGAWSRHPTALAIALGVATLVAILITAPFSRNELYNEQRSFRDHALDRSLSRDRFHALAREAMLRHPAEPYFPFVGAVRAIVARDESVLPWAGRALERSPVYGRVHLLIARSLFAKNPSQARLEYRLACLQDTQLCYQDELFPLVGGYEDATELVPEGPRGAIVLGRLTDRLRERLPSTVVRLDRDLVAREPTALGPVERAAAAALTDVRNEESWCAGDARRACVAEGISAAQRLRTSVPDRCEGHALLAELRVASGDVDAGFAELDGALDQVVDRSICARRIVGLAQQTGNAARVDAAIERLLKLGCETSSECVDNFLFAASIESRRGRERRAFILTKKAWERVPERDDLLAEVGARAEAQGLHGEALEAYTKLGERHPEDKRWPEAIARERDAVARGIFQRR
jgi:hypothetical protein